MGIQTQPVVSQAELQALPTGSVTATILLTSAAIKKIQRALLASLEDSSRVTVTNPKTQWNSPKLSHSSPSQLIASNSAS
jgi:hypothetical protein